MEWKAWIRGFILIIKSLKARLHLAALAFISCYLLSACTNNAVKTQNFDFSISSKEIIIDTYLDNSRTIASEQLISQISKVIDQNQNLTIRDRASLFYELGILYDGLGLYLSAKSMFMNAIIQDPSYSKPYAFLAAYLALENNYQDSMEAYDSAIELDKTDLYAKFSRALTLYYVGRYTLAKQDLSDFYEENKNDPYRILWYFLIENKIDGLQVAKANLKERYRNAIKDENNLFAYKIIEYYLGIQSKDQIFKLLRTDSMNNIIHSEMLCEGYFYLAQMELIKGKNNVAFDYFRLALATNVYAFLEYRYAKLELDKLIKAQIVH